MDPSRYARLKEAVLTAAALPEGERSAWLRHACQGDAPLLAEAESLLAQRGSTAASVRTGGLEEALAAALDRAAAAAGPGGERRPPTRIGPYRILGVLGEGGMGTVYHALQETPVEREVAIKVVRAGLDSASVLARFESERQTHARLDHPGIARLLDAGTTEDDHPYFAMEMVLGVPITSYAQAQHLDRAARLRLFLDVCRAVRHAHRLGIVHRDLKPSNVLVTLVNDLAAPKVIDFSIARALDEPAGERSTRTGQIVGTVEYMSPEQARGDIHAVGTPSDVYALGVLLYELLADRLPYDVADRPLHEAVKVIVEEPPRPLRETAASQTGRIDPDVETITRKCLEKDPDRRYASASDLVEDLERHLAGRPILARPPSAVYQTRKFVARHRVGVAAISAVLLALVAGIIGTSIGLVRANRARAEAEDEARTSREVTGFLTGLFEVSDPSEARGSSVTARELLDKGAAKIRENLKDQPRVQARLMATMGETYVKLGLHEPALGLFEEALRTQQALLGPDHLESVATLGSLGWTLYNAGRMEDAEKTLRDALERSRRLLGPEHRDTLERANNLAVTLWKRGQLAEAGTLLAQDLEIEQRLFGEDDVLTLKTTNNLGILYAAQGRIPEAYPLFEKTLAARRRLYGDTHPLLVTATTNLGMAYGLLGRADDATRLLQESVAVATRVYGEDNVRTLKAKGVLASGLGAVGRMDESSAMLRSISEIERRTLGESHPETIETLARLAEMEGRAGHLEESAATYSRAVEAFRRVVGPEAVDTLHVVRLAALVEARCGRLTEARRMLREALESMTRVSGPKTPLTLGCAAQLACIESQTGAPREARARLQQAVADGWNGLGDLENNVCADWLQAPEVAALLAPLRKPPTGPAPPGPA